MNAVRDYQPQKNNPYKLPHELYMRVLYLVRDYARIRAARADILYGTPERSGPPAGGHTSPTENKALHLYALGAECDAVDNALAAVPKEYRRGVWENITRRAPYPADAGAETYGRWRRRFLYLVAKNLHLI